MLDTEALRTFIAVADSGSFTKAGEMIGRTQSAVSMQIKKLEEQVGKSVLIREHRALKLTPEGEMLLDKGRQIIRLSNETMAALTKPEMSGLVRLGIPDDYAECYLPPILRSLSVSHPNIEFELVAQNSEELLERIKRSEIDLAFVTSGLGGSDHMVVRSEPIMWVKAEGSDLDFRDPIPLASFGRERPWCIHLMSHLDRLSIPYRIVYSSTSYAGFSGAILAGLALSCLPMSALRPGMEVLSQASPVQPVTFSGNVVMESRPGLPRFIEVLRDEIVHLAAGIETPVTIEKNKVILKP